MNFFDQKDLGNHLLQLCPKVVKHSVYEMLCTYLTENKLRHYYKIQPLMVSVGITLVKVPQAIITGLKRLI